MLGKCLGEDREEARDVCGGWHSEPQQDRNLNQVGAVGTGQEQIQGYFRSRTGKNHYSLDTGGFKQDPQGNVCYQKKRSSHPSVLMTPKSTGGSPEPCLC